MRLLRDLRTLFEIRGISPVEQDKKIGSHQKLCFYIFLGFDLFLQDRCLNPDIPTEYLNKRKE